MSVGALQAVDFVAWAVGQKYRSEINRYYELIGDRVVAEKIIEV